MKTKTFSLILSDQQLLNITDCISEEISNNEDYLSDRTYDDNEEEKEYLINRIRDLNEVLIQLVKQRDSI